MGSSISWRRELTSRFRIAHLDTSQLPAVRVGAVRRVVCASPAYLARTRRTPLRTPADLAKHDAVGFDSPFGRPDWTLSKKGVPTRVRPRTRLVVNSAEMAIRAALEGSGVVRLLSYMIAPLVQKGELEIVLSAWEPPAIPVHIVSVEGARAAARVRAFVRIATPRLRAALALGSGC